MLAMLVFTMFCIDSTMAKNVIPPRVYVAVYVNVSVYVCAWQQQLVEPHELFENNVKLQRLKENLLEVPKHAPVHTAACTIPAHLRRAIRNPRPRSHGPHTPIDPRGLQVPRKKVQLPACHERQAGVYMHSYRYVSARNYR